MSEKKELSMDTLDTVSGGASFKGNIPGVGENKEFHYQCPMCGDKVTETHFIYTDGRTTGNFQNWGKCPKCQCKMNQLH